MDFDPHEQFDAHSLSAFDPVPQSPDRSSVVKVHSERRPLVSRRIVAFTRDGALNAPEAANAIPRYARTLPESAAGDDGLELDSVAEHDSLNLRNVERGVDASSEGSKTKPSVWVDLVTAAARDHKNRARTEHVEDIFQAAESSLEVSNPWLATRGEEPNDESLTVPTRHRRAEVIGDRPIAWQPRQNLESLHLNRIVGEGG